MRYPEIESSSTELKRALPQKDQLIKTAIGFCNLHGGKIVIGVADDRTITGLTDQQIEAAMEWVDTTIYDACTPHIIPRLYAQRFGDKAALIVEVSEGMNKPYYRRSKGVEKGTYIRLGRHTMRATAGIIQELKWQSIGIDFERLPVYQATMSDLNQEEISRFLADRKNAGAAKIDEEVLKSYGLIAYDQSKKYPSILGILLFANQPQNFFSEAMLICSHFRGIAGREVVATIDCEGSLLNQFKQAFAFITERLYRSFSIKGLKRDEKLEIPEVAIREALLNAIVHRNYYIKAPIKIAVYDDRIEFFSPGQFPGPIHIDNLKAGISYLRNPMLCKIFRELDYIEKMGTGFITIFSSYEQAQLKSPQIIEGENYIKCILPRGSEKQQEVGEKDDAAKIIDLMKISGEITVKDVVQSLSISRATAVRRLNQLMDDDVVERIGQTVSIRYRLRRK